jgi:hypothetical protein
MILASSACKSPQSGDSGNKQANWIKPYAQNLKYWQYKNEPVLLLGATDDDNLFQMNGLEAHLDELVAAGGNYIRNTMSFRDSGNVCPFLMLEDGKYDLEQWSNDFWGRFESLLKLTNERDIIVQIEVWDRFDYSQQFWDTNPFNPLNNINYTVSDSILDESYPKHPSGDFQPFFHSIAGMPKYKTELARIRAYQEKMVDKMLNYFLNYGNVLYCMNNETTTPVEWGNYWIDYIRAKANEKEVEVYLTDMYDDFYKVNACERCKDLIAKPEYYTFMDISQINSRNFGQDHWDTLQVILAKRDQYALRPVNNTKIYGGGNYGFGSGSNEDGVERFCRNVVGGCASARHHRPPHGNGLNQKATASLKATRKAEEFIKFWEVSPRMELLSEREANEAYLTAKEGEKYLIYFPAGGTIKLDLKSASGEFHLKWISISSGEWGNEAAITGGKEVEIATPTDEGWYAVITK